MAQALERLGERWALLIVRDLLPGNLRFTDLLESCGGITPRQLSARLRQLEQDGIVEADRATGRREVRYRLTAAGQALRPTVEAFFLWGIRHLDRPPAPDEPIRPYHILNGTRLAIASAGREPSGPVRWAWRFPDESYTLRFDGGAWELNPGEDPDSEVVVETTLRDWADFVATPGGSVRKRAIRLVGRPARLREFTALFPRLAEDELARQRGSSMRAGRP